MRRTWNSWTYYSDGDTEHDEKEDVCHESKHAPVKSQKEEPKKGMLEDAYGRSMEQAMGEALERAMDLSDVRKERVARVKRAVEAGDYRVEAKELAQRLIRNMRGDYR
jgi:anti-sigma28 factor (negative regulator of flagellin synthesis)